MSSKFYLPNGDAGVEEDDADVKAARIDGDAGGERVLPTPLPPPRGRSGGRPLPQPLPLMETLGGGFIGVAKAAIPNAEDK